MRRFGKLAPKHDYRTLRLGDYMTASLPPPPPADDVVKRVVAKLGVSTKTLFPMDGNDQYGDCTIAALAHAVTAYRGLLGQKQIMTEAQVVALYLKLSGGQDSGLNELDVLNYWRQNQAGGDEILGYAKLNVKHHDRIKQAIHLFGGVYLGFQVQQKAETDFDAGRTWTPGRLTEDGHAVFATAYDPTTVTVLTWGAEQKGTWAWWDEAVDEAYVILPPEAKIAGWCPGIDFTALQADLKLVARA